jgi:putative CocE/NonD family hydrolase
MPGDAVRFDATGTTGGVAYHWDFGDGAQATGPTPEHTYTRAGVFTVVLTAFDAAGKSSSLFHAVAVSPAVHGLVREHVWVPSQGVQLNGWVTRPAEPGPWPTVVEYTAYAAGGLPDNDAGVSLVRSGYAYLIVSAPGLQLSEGTFDMFGPVTRRGGYDTVEWAAAQPWSNGDVALTGFSAPAIMSLLTASTHPPHLRAVVAKASYADLYRDLAYPGGVVGTGTFLNTYRAGLLALGVADAYNNGVLPDRAVGASTNAATDTVDLNTHPFDDDYWQDRRVVGQPQPTVPVLLYGTGHDHWPRSAPELFEWIRPAGGRLILCIGGHGCSDSTGREPALGIAPGATSDEPSDVVGQTIEWFDHFLKHVDNGVERGPTIEALVPAGGDAAVRQHSDGRWVSLQSWPAPGTTFRRLYFGAADSGRGKHSLTTTPPAAGEASDPMPNSPATGQTGAADENQQVLYETTPLDVDTDVVGPVTATLWTQLIGEDAAFKVRINDVAPDGTTVNVSEGVLLASERALDPARSRYTADGQLLRAYHPHTAREILTPATPYELQVEVWPTLNRFRVGHRIQVTVAGQALANAQVQSAYVTPAAAAVLLHDADHPSSVLLPLLPANTPTVPFPRDLEGPPLPAVPESGVPVLLPLIALAATSGLVVRRRRLPRRSA